MNKHKIVNKTDINGFLRMLEVLTLFKMVKRFLLQSGFGILFLSVFLFTNNAQAQIDKITLEYIKEYKGIAIHNMKKFRIPASITLAQGILESGSGRGRLAKKANNHFGIKCHNDWKGRTFHMNDDARHECFRKYRNPEASFADHSRFLTNKGRYSFLFRYPITDYKRWAYGLKKAGYATNPKYPQLLISIIERYKLYQYDRPGTRKKEIKQINKTITYSKPDINHFQLAGKNRVGRPYYINNGKKLIIVRSGDHLKKIAFDFEIPWRKLLHYNDIKKSFVLHPGDLIYLQKKKRKSQKPFRHHVVQSGESLWEIAQLYGIRLKSLRNKNNLPKKYQPKAGTRLKLR